MIKPLRRHRLAIALTFGCAAQPFAAGAINSAQIIVSFLEQRGYQAELAAEAMEVLLYVDKIAPGQQRFAQLMEQLVQLTPPPGPEQAVEVPEKTLPAPEKGGKSVRERAG